MSITSVKDWANLPEIGCPVIKDTKSRGTVYVVHKLGFLAASRKDCENLDTSGALIEHGKVILPTAEVEFAGERQLCRLPLPLSDWAIDLIALVNETLHNPLPTQIQFGVLAGRYYAEML